jgi:hypothetical protein
MVILDEVCQRRGLTWYNSDSYNAGTLVDDLYQFYPATATWTLFSQAQTGAGPSARTFFGLTSLGDSLFAFGGMEDIGLSKSAFDNALDI